MQHYLTCLCFLLAASFTLAQESVPIVRVSQPPSIDARAEDWPIPATAALASADGKATMRFAADANAFYAFAEVEDPSPLKNGAASPQEIIGGGDAVAFYFQTTSTDAQRVALTERNGKAEAYAYRTTSTVKAPYTFTSPVAEAAFDYVGPIAAEVAFRKLRRGDYVMEVAIPWQALGFDQAPQRFRFDAQVLFSDPGGTQTMGMAWLVATDGPGQTIEDLPAMARLYPDSWGQATLVDELRVPPSHNEAQPVNIAEMTMIEVDLPRDGRLSLNITDEDGWILRELVRAESYTAGRHRIGWDGRDRYGEALPAGEYQWQALLFDGMRTTFMGSVGNSGRPPYRTPDGLGSMGGQHGANKAVAADADGIYMSGALQEGPPNMRKMDPVTGEALWKRAAGGFRAFDAIAAGEGMACVVNSYGKRGNNETYLIRIDPETGRDLKMGDGGARVLIPDANAFYDIEGLAIADGIAWYSMPKHNRIAGIDLRTGASLAPSEVPQPLSLARRDASTLLVCSGNAVLAFDTATRETTPIIEELDEPKAVAVDSQGRIYVSETGETEQVSRFSADGKRQATWGKPGGSSNQQLPYEPMAFRNVTGIAIGPNGNIWLAEETGLVKRFIKLSETGDWLEDFYGPVAYNAFGPDLDDFSRVYYTVAAGAFVETHVDYEQYQREPRKPQEAWHIRAIHDMGLAADGVSENELMREVAKTGYGHVIAFRANNGERYFFRLSKHNRARAPVGAGIWIDRDGRWVPCAFITRNEKEHPSWADANGDGLIQEEEQYTGLPVQDASWLGRDLTLHGFAGTLTPASFTASGAPVYKDGAYDPYLAEGNSGVPGGWTFFSPAYGDTIYYISNIGSHRHLSFWDRATENRLIKVSDGKVQWIAGKHAAHPGFTEFSTNSGVAGMVDGVVLVQNIEPANYIAYTEDGFVLGDVMVDEEGRHPKVGPYVINIESFTGLYVKEEATGRNVLFAVSSGDDRILEIKGPGQTTRLRGSVDLRKAAALGRQLSIPYSTWYGNTARGLGVDAVDDEWRPEVQAVSLEADGTPLADVRLRRDAGNLYLFANVLDPEPAAGDAITLTLTDDPEALMPQRATLTLTLAKDAQGAWQLQPTLHRNGEAAPEARIKTAIAERWQGLGYRLEAELPIALLHDLAEPREQRYRRRGKETRDMTTHTETLPDLKQPLHVTLTVQHSGTTATVSDDIEIHPSTP